MRKIRKKWIALFAAATLFMAGTAPVCGQTASEKEEVVYGQLAGDGSAKEIYVVNIFENQEHILDYGNYQSVRNMTSQDKINQKGDRITLQTKDQTLYYQGNLEKGQLPWNISLSYYLNGEPVTPQQLAGKSGSLELVIKVRENKKAEPDFFENYALQITASFDTELCTSIKTKGATEANAGGKRQLTWTLLPGTERSLKIRTQVTDFQMDPISFNGVRLDMDVNVETGQLTKKFAGLSAAAAAIDAGAKDLSAGAAALNNGAEKLESGVGMFSEKTADLGQKAGQAEKLPSASGEIKGAIGAISQGIAELKEAAGYQALKQTLKQRGLDLDSLKAGNQQLLEALSSLKAMENIPAQYQQQILQAEQVLEGNLAAIDGTEGYLNALSQSISQVHKGAGQLEENYKEFDEGLSQICSQISKLDLSQISNLEKGAGFLAGGSKKLSQGSSALSQGTGVFRQSTSGMESQVSGAIDEMLSGISGSSAETVSFVSQKNTRVKAVQFVIKNDPIEGSESQPPKEEPEKVYSWWQKLLNLFGIS